MKLIDLVRGPRSHGSQMMTTASMRLRLASVDNSAWRALAVSWLGWVFDGYETYALVLTMAPAVRQILPQEAAKAPIYMGGLLAATLLGRACGGIAAGVLTDYIGRKRTLILSIFWYAFFAGLTALSRDYWSFIVFRLFTGFALGAEWGPGAALVAELWPPLSRGRAAGVLHSAIGAGIFFASGIWLLLSPLGPSAWRYMFVVGVLPAFLLLYLRRGVHEPSLWVTADAQRREAQRRLQVGIGSEQDQELTRFTVKRILSRSDLRRRVSLLLLMSISTVVGWWSASTWIPQYAEELSARAGPPFQTAASSVVLMFSAGAFVGYISMGILADRLGRKPAIWLYYLGSLVFSLSLFLLVTERPALLIAAAANGFFTTGQFSWLTIYLPELFPTSVRGSAMSLVFEGSRILASAGPLFGGWLISSLGGIGRAAATMSLIYLIGLIVTPFAGPETKGKPVPQ
jgi:MFS family permease